MRQLFDETSAVDESNYISGQIEATVSDRINFIGQELDYVTDGKLFLLTTHANFRSRKSAKSFRFLMANEIRTGTYALDGLSPEVVEASYVEHTTRGSFTYQAEVGSINIKVHPATRHYIATFNFTGRSHLGLTLEVKGSFDIRVLVD